MLSLCLGFLNSVESVSVKAYSPCPAADSGRAGLMAWGPRPGPEGSGVAGEGRGRAVVAPHGLGETSDRSKEFNEL